MQIAVLIPCFNEEETIGKVIADFKKELPEAKIYIGDNNSSDRTAEIASASGALVIQERRQGKGYVVQKLLSRIEADVYVLVDGDDTYRATDVHRLLQPVIEQKCDMCIGNRLRNYQAGSFSFFHLFGNKLIRILTYKLHRVDIPDMLSGYRVMNRRLVDEVCLIMGGFEIETEINIKSVWHGFKIASADINYGLRPPGSISKIKTFHDGYRILSTILMLLREHQPMTMGGIIFLVLNLLGVALLLLGIGLPHIFAFNCGLVCFLLGSIALATGIILHAINISHREGEKQRIRSLRGRPPKD